MLNTVLGILLIVMAVFLVVTILLQSSKDHRMSGTIAGGAETFFGKQKGKTIDGVLNKITAVVCILFFISVLAMYVTSDNQSKVIPPVDGDVNTDIDNNVDVDNVENGETDNTENNTDTENNGESDADAGVDADTDADADANADVNDNADSDNGENKDNAEADTGANAEADTAE